MGASYSADTDELFLADWDSNVSVVCFLRDLYPRGRVIYSAQKQGWYTQGVRFMGASGTLLVFNNRIIGGASDCRYRYEYSVVALSRAALTWREVSHETLWLSPFFIGKVQMCAYSDAEVMFGFSNTRDLWLVRVDNNHQITPGIRISTTEKYVSVATFVAQNETRVVLTFGRGEDTSVGLFALRPAAFEQLSRLALRALYSEVVCVSGRLLVAEFNDPSLHFHTVSEVSAADDRLVRGAQLLRDDAGVRIDCWCAAGDSLLIWDRDSEYVRKYDPPPVSDCHHSLSP